jgi:hypothetical protein
LADVTCGSSKRFGLHDVGQREVGGAPSSPPPTELLSMASI